MVYGRYMYIDNSMLDYVGICFKYGRYLWIYM